MFHRQRGAALVWSAGLISSLAATAASQEARQEASPHTEAASALLGVSASSIGGADLWTEELRASGRSLRHVKGVLASGHVLHGVFDESGHVVRDRSALLKRERQARDADPSYKLDAELRAALPQLPAGDPVRVMVWLESDGDVLDQHARAQLDAVSDAATREEIRAVERSIDDHHRRVLAGILAPFVRRVQQQGVAPYYVGELLPVVALDVTPVQIQWLAAQPEVDTVYLETANADDLDMLGNVVHRIYRPMADDCAYGDGIDVAVLENNGVDPACPHLAVAGWFNAGSPNPDGHIHSTCGIIASHLHDRLGATPSVNLYSANAASYGEADVTAVAEWCAATNKEVTNNSWGGDRGGAESYWDRMYDYLSRYSLDSFVASAGNTADGHVGSPGTSWNVITVGAFDAAGTRAWSDDGMAYFSSYLDPASGCQKPNLAAIGVDIKTLDDSAAGWIDDSFNGTSGAAPYVTASLAMAMTSHSDLILSPECAMASMMASAWNNIEGSGRLSDQDGAGGLDGGAVYAMASDSRVDYVTLDSGSFSTSGFYTYNIDLVQAQIVRVCIAWSANADSSYTTTALDADLDLAVYQGADTIGGVPLGWSNSLNNNYEIVRFKVPATDTYTLRVNDARFDGTNERVGFAWSIKSKDR